MRFSRSLLFTAALLLAGSATNRNARAALLAYEPFTNAPGSDIIGSGDGFGFSGAWQSNGSGGVATNTDYGLKYTDSLGNTLVTTGGAGFFQGLTSANTSMQPIRLFSFARGTNGTDGETTWISFLAVRQGPAVSGSNPFPRGANVPHDINAGALQKLAIGNSSGATVNTVGLIPQGSSANLKSSAVPFSQTNFIVVRIDHTAGDANDSAYLFVNPNLAGEPSLNQADANSIGGFDFSFDRLRVFAGGNASASQPYAELVLDEYRLGQTFADVTPHITSSIPTGFMITNAAIYSDNFVISGIGGSNNAGLLLLASTNLTMPMTNWLTVASNTFDANGNFVVTSAVPTGVTAEFYRVSIAPSSGGSGESPITNGFFVAQNGSDSYPGTYDRPFLTIGKGVNAVGNGGQLYIRGGVYALSSKLRLSNIASSTNRIRIWAYPGEQVVIDSTGNSSDGISVSGDGYYLKGLTVAHAGHNGINISGASNIVELCTTCSNANTGLHITGDLSTSYNLILNCDSFHNYDAATHGQNADGFSAKWVFGPGNVFSGCRAWENADDGWDLWMGTNTVVITNCWAIRNGTNVFGDPAWEGNGNGFKLGGNYVGTPHRLVRSLAVLNMANGVDQNNNLAGQTLDNNTCWGNRGRNFSMAHGANTTPHIVRNNISFGAVSGDSFTSGTLSTNNSWQIITSPSASASDFQSMDYSALTGSRHADGSLPDLPFLHPVIGGRLVDKGVDTGDPFSGNAPDLGAFEVQ